MGVHRGLSDDGPHKIDRGLADSKPSSSLGICIKGTCIRPHRPLLGTSEQTISNRSVVIGPFLHLSPPRLNDLGSILLSHRLLISMELEITLGLDVAEYLVDLLEGFACGRRVRKATHLLVGVQVSVAMELTSRFWIGKRKDKSTQGVSEDEENLTSMLAKPNRFFS